MERRGPAGQTWLRLSTASAGLQLAAEAAFCQQHRAGGRVCSAGLQLQPTRKESKQSNSPYQSSLSSW